MSILAVIDTETTGLPNLSVYARIVEVAAVLVNEELEIVGQYESVCNPGHVFAAGAGHTLTINGLHTRQIAEAPVDWRVGRHFRKWLLENDVVGVTSWKTAFDFHQQLLMAPQWLGPVIPPLVLAPCARQVVSGFLHVGGRWSALADVMTMMGIQRKGMPHEALSDAYGAADTLIKAIRGDGHRGQLWAKYFTLTRATVSRQQVPWPRSMTQENMQ